MRAAELDGGPPLPMNGLNDGIDPWLRLELDGYTLIVTLNRPERRNAVAWGQIVQIATVLERASADRRIRAVIITGEGVAFCAGGDVKDQASRQSWGTVERLRRSEPMIAAVQAVWDFPKPLIAAVNGVATGAGVGIALLCDTRLASTEARLGFAFVRVGLGPDYGVSYTLPRTVGPGHAARLLYSGADVDAEEGRALGLVDSLHAPERLLPDALALAGEIAERAPFGVRLAKAALRRSGSADLATTLRTEMQGQFLASGTEDHREGTAAFAEKRAPRFCDG